MVVGWRARCWFMPRSTCFACAPVHFLVFPTADRRPIMRRAAPRRIERRFLLVFSRAPFLLLTLMLAGAAFVFTGAMVRMIEILRGWTSAGLGGAAGLDDRPSPGHRSRFRAAVRSSLLDHAAQPCSAQPCCHLSAWGLMYWPAETSWQP